MRSILMIVMSVFLTHQISYAQKTLSLRESSRVYDMTVQVSRCGEDKDNLNRCEKASISFYRKGAEPPFQVLDLPGIEINMGRLVYNPQIDRKPRISTEDEYSFVFDDFNFDGKEDFAVRNGRGGGYSGPSYSVFLYNDIRKLFVKSRHLSELTLAPYLGLFLVDPEKQYLTAFTKSGCCFQETKVFRSSLNFLGLIEETTEEVDMVEGVTTITTRKKVNARWVKDVRREKTK
jgi:hypothetical protein